MSASPSNFSLYKRGSHYHILYYLHSRRRWKSTGATTKRDALKALSRFQELLNKTPNPVSLKEFCERFFRYAESTYSPRTVETYERALPRFLKLVGDLLLVEITAEHFDHYKGERLKRVSPVTVNIELRSLRAAFNTARRWNLIERHPFVDVSMAALPRQTPIFVSPQDFQQLLEGIQEKWLRDVVIFAVLTGMRRGEILNLRWLDVDLVRRVVHIESRPGFHSKQGQRRTIPLNETATLLLDSRRGKSTSEFVFTLNDRQIFGDWVTHLFKRYVREVGFNNDRLRFHSLRHTFASWLVQGGATLYEVQKLLGHSSSRVTEIYSHLQPEHLHKTVNRIEVSLN